jgi:O-antigen/teichoic acid export membrane protein
LAANIFCAAFALGLVCYELSAPKLRFFLFEWRLGLLYSLEYATLSGMKDLDKPIVLAALGAEASGHYAAAYRVVEAASAPIMGLLYATYTGYFKSAHSHWSEGIRFGMRVLPYGVVMSAGASIFLLGISEYLPMILGADFEKSVLLVQILCLHPILRIVAGIGSDILRAINLQGLRVTIMIVSTVAVLPAAWIGIKLGALSGAAMAGQTVSLLAALCVWAFILRKSGNREDASSAHA